MRLVFTVTGSNKTDIEQKAEAYAQSFIDDDSSAVVYIDDVRSLGTWVADSTPELWQADCHVDIYDKEKKVI